jgi:hypothetical protein
MVRRFQSPPTHIHPALPATHSLSSTALWLNRVTKSRTYTAPPWRSSCRAGWQPASLTPLRCHLSYSFRKLALNQGGGGLGRRRPRGMASNRGVYIPYPPSVSQTRRITSTYTITCDGHRHVAPTEEGQRPRTQGLCITITVDIPIR